MNDKFVRIDEFLDEASVRKVEEFSTEHNISFARSLAIMISMAQMVDTPDGQNLTSDDIRTLAHGSGYWQRVYGNH